MHVSRGKTATRLARSNISQSVTSCAPYRAEIALCLHSSIRTLWMPKVERNMRAFRRRLLLAVSCSRSTRTQTCTRNLQARGQASLKKLPRIGANLLNTYIASVQAVGYKKLDQHRHCACAATWESVVRAYTCGLSSNHSERTWPESVTAVLHLQSPLACRVFQIARRYTALTIVLGY